MGLVGRVSGRRDRVKKLERVQHGAIRVHSNVEAGGVVSWRREG